MQLFSTKHFQLGMGPMGLEVGDKVTILHGSGTPCTLRAVDEAQNEHRAISQCFLDGWMFGKHPKAASSSAMVGGGAR
ncbi:hypothetical protein BU25DRAFT_407263 [Macroventuria anomochaeta]|uniref:Uncharacterized protein n=1 Tax=Macroventuria anomochaeta TaxID=301207 RepID=A0ACB6SE87_9PLEO|nr:uncharacterized protein BU25DRAFT_407263 [Macroventuria anomochaeta]KAF2631619.1 hypothetical protein BU25DRAFT_407263 [Macroventuria anomochaeta]